MNNLAYTHNHQSLDVLKKQLANHPLYSAIEHKHQLIYFMEQHVFAVWDFMSLIKSAQNQIAPTTTPWTPSANPEHVNFINQLVLEEESDHEFSQHAQHSPRSHFEHYLEAMNEIGANTDIINSFINNVRIRGLEPALTMSNVPNSARKFMQFTFEVINLEQTHLTVAVLAHGREDVVPLLFRSLQNNLKFDQKQASKFFTYLNRHIELDEQSHAPILMKLLQDLCSNSEKKHTDVIELAERALIVRLEFWDDIYQSLK